LNARIHATREPVFEVLSLPEVNCVGEVEVHALRGVDLDLYAGEQVVVRGPSGSGTVGYRAG